MPKTMRESKMLELVRRWRAEAYESLRHEPLAARRQRTAEWSRRLDLPIVDDEKTASEQPERRRASG